METYESEIKSIKTSADTIFNTLSDLTLLEKIDTSTLNETGNLNSYLKNAEFSEDACFFQIETLGRVGFRIIERTPFKTIKFEAQNSPVAANAWIQLVEATPNDTRMKLTVKAEIPKMIKMMINSKLKEGINLIADAIAKGLNEKYTKEK